ncbi:hypothetical protein BIW11_02714 [Tropilaelaps mercedesae]|uniref:Uncharacterized protein n=1 Tax=Tropilaelaps mercedesae TaxID=418985 RepID=A0A1V9XYJ9_9ACAR|nr:hypothetical protein BIW11_02714 [Tropilaelaps mercedesae]
MPYRVIQGAVTHELNTQSSVRWAQYCAVNNHVATIEDRILYVYQMWWLTELRIKALGVAECAAWCHSSGRLAVSNGHIVTVYEDVSPLFEFTGFHGIKSISLCENVLSVQSSTHVLVINLNEDKYPTSDDEVIWNFDQEDLIINASTLASPPKIEQGKMQSKIPENIKEVYLPDRPIYGLNVNVKDLCNDHVYQPRVLLLKRMQPTFMSLIAYHTCVNKPIPDPLAPTSKKLDYVSLVLAEPMHGELFCVQGTRGRGIVSFTKRAESIAVDECYMHVLNSDSLITYALPLPGLSSDWEPYNLSMHRMNMKHLLMAGDHLVVLSGREVGEMTVYSLLKPTTSEFFGDLLSTGVGAVLERAKDIVRMQFRIYGEGCSQRLLTLYSDIENSKPIPTIEDVLDGNAEARKLDEAFAETDLPLILKEEKAPDILKLACMLPMAKSSAANPADYASVLEDIIKVARPGVLPSYRGFKMASCDKGLKNSNRK